MKILVCVRRGLDGELSPFDASAYEAALQISGAEVTLLSMGPPSAADFLHGLTRLGAKRAILLTDPVFAGADTLATAYALSRAAKKLLPDLILCGRQTLVGDTAQTGVMLAGMLGCSCITGVMRIEEIGEGKIICTARETGMETAAFPALLTLERIHTLRLPSILSRLGKLDVWNAADVDADPSKCGLLGSPTRVLASFENHAGKRKCQWIKPSDLGRVIQEVRRRQTAQTVPQAAGTCEKLDRVFAVGKDAMRMAQTVCDDVTVLEKTDGNTLAQIILREQPNAVIWASDAWSKRTSALVAARLGLGLCADCTALEADEGRLVMYRPALSGSVIAKIISNTTPAMATVRTEQSGGEIMVAAGFGAKDSLPQVRKLAELLGAELGASRKAVDRDLLPYELQVGLTGKTVAPPVYLALGISGAVHHVVGMQRAGTVIAVNCDPDAPIFEYADFGIVAELEDVLSQAELFEGGTPNSWKK